MEEEIKVEEKVEVKVKVKVEKIISSPEQIASRQLAHDIKVAKFLAGGKF